MTVALGDFIQTPMASDGQASLIWTGQKNIQVTIANQDLVNTVTIGRRSNFTQNGSNTLSLPALGSVTVDGSKSIWALAPPNTANILVIPGGGQWAPAPSQVAASIDALGLMKDTTGQTINGTLGTPAQDGTVSGVNFTLVNQTAKDTSVNGLGTTIPNNISTTGVPLLSNQSQIASQTSRGLAHGASWTSAVFNVNNLSFEFVITAPMSLSDSTPYSLVIIQWIDSVSGLMVAKDSFVILNSTNILPTAPHVLRGPCKGDQVQVTLVSFTTASDTFYTFTFLTNSRITQDEQLDMVFNWNQDNSATILTATRDYPDSKVLATFVNGSLAAGATDTWISPPHNGPAWFNLWETGVAGSNISVTANPMPNGVYGSTPWLVNDDMVSGNPNKMEKSIILPMGPIQWKIKNGGSVAANYGGMLVAQ